MKASFELVAELRDGTQGKGASRRLRHAGRVPAIMYGGHVEPLSLSFEHEKLQVASQNERFFTTLLTIKIGDKTQPAILKDIQRHPSKPVILHLDLQRIVENEQIRMSIPLHFINANIAPGVKTGGGQVSHLLNEVEVNCLPKDLPSYLEVDMGKMELNQSLHLSDLVLPAGVELVLLAHGRDEAVVSVHHARVAEEAAPAAEAAAAAGAKPAAAPAKKEGGKK